MNLGILNGSSGNTITPDGIVADVALARDARFASYWIPQLPWAPTHLLRSRGEGLESPADVGNESQVAEQLAAVFEAGADTVICPEFGSPDDLTRTREALGALL